MMNQVGGALIIFQFVSASCFIVLTLHYAGDEHSYLRRLAANVVFGLILAAVPCSPVLEKLWRSGNEKCYHQCLPVLHSRH